MMRAKARTCGNCGVVLPPRVRCQSEQCFAYAKRNNSAMLSARLSNIARQDFVPAIAVDSADLMLRVRRGY